MLKRTFLLWLFAALVAVGAPVDADFLLDGENSTIGTTLTTTIVGNMSHTGTNWPAGTWTINGSFLKVGGSEKSSGQVTVNGVTYDDVGSTRSIEFGNFFNQDNGYVRRTFTTPVTSDISVGCWVYISADIDGGAKFPDIFRINASGGGWVVCQLHDLSSPKLIMHTGNDSSATQPDGADIAFAYDTWQYITMQAVHGGTCTLSLYNASGTLVGSSSRNPNISHPWALFDFGRADQHGVSPTYAGSAFFEDIIFDFTDATFPLGPGTAAPPSGPRWVSSTGAASWASAQNVSALSGTACASLATMNANAAAGDQVYLRAGTYGSGTKLNPAADGASGNPIIIEAYQSETVTFSNFSKAQGPALSLTNRDYITFRKLNTTDVQESVIMDNCTHLRFEDCTFLNSKNTASGYDMVIRVQNNSQFNVFARVRAGDLGYESDLGGVMYLGTTNSDTDATRYNYFYDCEFRRGGHHVITSAASFNVFDRCFIHSEEWYGSQPYGGRGFISEDADGNNGGLIPAHGNDTFRDCIFFRCGDPAGSDGVSNASLRTKRNRMIRCVFVDGSNNGVSITGGDADDNRIAHCVFARNGVNTPMAVSDQRGAVMFFSVSGDPAGNAVKNCIFRDNFAEFSYEDFSPGGQTLSNNWLQATGNPQFVDWTTADLDPSNKAAHDFHLQAGSGAINNGGWLTTTAGASSGTSLVVTDSYWFTDGNGIAPGDVIQLQGSTTLLTITGIDYSTHTLTISPATAWSSGAGVGFPYSGSAPDQGAFETASGSGSATATAIHAGAVKIGN